MNAKDLQIDTWRKEAADEYEQWLDSLNNQPDLACQLMEHPHETTPTEDDHAEVCD